MAPEQPRLNQNLLHVSFLYVSHPLQPLVIIKISKDGQKSEDQAMDRKTVEAHRAHIMEKLQLEGAPALIRYAAHWVPRADAL